MKLTFDKALELLNGGIRPDMDNVLASALKRKVWIYERHIPGHISEILTYSFTKQDAIDSVLMMCDNERGAVAALRNFGVFVSNSPLCGKSYNSIQKVSLGEML